MKLFATFVALALAQGGENCGVAGGDGDPTICTEDGACCGYAIDAAKINRACSAAAGATPDSIEPPIVFSCDDPNGDDGASRIAVGAAILATALYM